jgi:hypothetical protein
MATHFQRALRKFIHIDKIRFYKLFELLQYSTVFLFLAIILSRLVDRLYSATETELNEMSSPTLFFEMVCISFIYCVVSYYTLKFAHVVPSLMNLIDSDFHPHTTLDYSVHMVFIVVFVSMNDTLANRLKQISHRMNQL